jgi:hypothetical protein
MLLLGVEALPAAHADRLDGREPGRDLPRAVDVRARRVVGGFVWFGGHGFGNYLSS